MSTESERIQIRPATEGDLPAILEIVAQSVPIMQAAGNPQWNGRYPNEEVFRKDIAENSLYLCEWDGEAAGMVCVNREQPKDYAAVNWSSPEPAAAVHRMAILPALRGNGIGEALLAHAVRVAAEGGCVVLRTDTHSTNAAMNGLLQKCGYRFSGPVRLSNKPGLYHCYEKAVQAPLR